MASNTGDRFAVRERIAQAFSPGAPIDDQTLFAGRLTQLSDVFQAISQRGQHAIIFGERGVGKTSLANVVTAVGQPASYVTVRVNCDGSESFVSIWRKVFREIAYTRQVAGLRFGAKPEDRAGTYEAWITDEVGPEDIRYAVQRLGKPSVFVIDEADRIGDRAVTGLLADTIKSLSDHSAPATIILIGVADNVDELISEHLSVERALVQVRMPRMSRAELSEIVDRGFKKIRFKIDSESRDRIILLSEGLPHYTHLLSLYAALSACDDERRSVTLRDVEWAIKAAIEKAQQSIRSAYYKATTSPQKETLYAQVLLACALTRTDALGYFAAADVREPMSRVSGKPYDIPAFSRHLNDFCEPDRGPVLQKVGTARRFRFRFINPLMQPFIIMHGLAHGLVDEATLRVIDNARFIDA